MATFIGAKKEEEIIFTRGCTESINIVAGSFARGILKKGDEILISSLEHHANIVPWQLACNQTGAKLKTIKINENGDIDLESYQNSLNKSTRIVSLCHTSHALGNKPPVKEMIKIAHSRDIPVLIDGAQAAPHMNINMKELDCDFYTFSGHKMGTLTGVGVLYGKKDHLKKLPPYEGGADMSTEVSFKKFSVADLPFKFEAGTMPFAEIISFETLIDFLNSLNRNKTEEYEKHLLEYATQKLSKLEHVKIKGTKGDKEPVLSFTLENMDVKKLESFLNDEYNIAVRAGDLTAQPLMKILAVKGLLRASFTFYNTTREIDVFAEAVAEFIDENK